MDGASSHCEVWGSEGLSQACLRHGLLPQPAQHVWPKHAVGARMVRGSRRSCAAGSGSGGCAPCLPHSRSPERIMSST